MLASEVMDRARVHLNDVGVDLFNNDVLLPFLTSAWEELQSTMQAHGLPIMTETSSMILLPAGGIVLGTSAVAPYPTLPANFIEPKAVYERAPGTMRWEEMTEAHGIINYNPQTALGVWEWDGDSFKFVGATGDREILLRYLKGLPEITSEATNLPITGAKRYLALKTAAEAAEDIGQNRTKADRLETKAEFEMNRFLAIRVKLQQDVSVRRRGYNSPQRSRGWSSLLPY
jgi:hypothetical protein